MPEPKTPNPVKGPGSQTVPAATVSPETAKSPRPEVKAAAEAAPEVGRRRGGQVRRSQPARRVVAPRPKRVSSSGRSPVAIPSSSVVPGPSVVPPKAHHLGEEEPSHAGTVAPGPAPTATGPQAAGPVVPVRVFSSTATKPVTTALGRDVIACMKGARKLTLEAVTTWVDVVGRFVPELPMAPYVPGRAEVVAGLGTMFDTAEELLASQRKFASDLVKILVPAG